MAPSDGEGKALIAALQAYQLEESLTKEQKSALRLQSTQNLLDGIDPGLLPSLKEKDRSLIRKGMEHLRPFMDALTHLAPGMDVFANADPHGLLSLVWGSVRMVLIVANDFQNFIEDIVQCFLDVKPDLERLRFYLSTFQQSKRLQNSLSIVYCEIMHMCSWLRDFFQSSKTRRLFKHVFTPTGLKTEARSHITKVKSACQNAESDAFQAHAQANMEAHKQLKGQNDQLYQKLSKIDLDNEARTKREGMQQASNLLRAIGEWLDPVPMADELERRKRDTLAGTCSWIEQYRSVSTWLWERGQSRHGAIWITAQPGYGKSHIATHLVETRLPRYPCAFFFCSATHYAHSNALSVLRTLAWQILQDSKDKAYLLQPSWETGAKLSLDAIRRVLETLLDGQKTANILIDGLDECPIAERKILLNHLRYLSAKSNVMILSRPELDIVAATKGRGANIASEHIELSPTENLADIKRFTRSQVKALELDVDLETQTKIVETIWSRADGMFLWVRLVVDELETQKYFQHGELESLLEVVASFPAGLEAAYSRAAGVISDQRSVLRDTIRLLLTWVIFAKRPLTLHELEAATTYQLNAGRGKAQAIRVPPLLRDFCRAFVAIDPATDRVRSIHETAAYFLVHNEEAGEVRLDAGEAHRTLASACVGATKEILSSLAAEPHIDNSGDALEGSRTADLYAAFRVGSTFLEYAVLGWPLHLSSLEDPDGTKRNTMASSLQLMEESDGSEVLSKTLKELLSSDTLILRWIRVATCFRMERRPLVESLLDTVTSWTRTDGATDDFDRDPVSAVQTSLPKCVLRFISHIGRAPGGRVHRLRKYMDIHTRFPVQYFELNHFYAAAFFDYDLELKRLVESGADAKLQVGVSTALIYAAAGESPAAIDRLLDLGVDVNLISAREDDSALSRSYESSASDNPGPYAAANKLLDRGARLHPPRAPSNVLTFLTASNNELPYRLAAVERLFKTATDKDLEYSGRTFGWLPLHEVVHRNEPEMVEALLKHHTKPVRYASIATHDTGKLALHIACERDQSRVVNVILKYAKGSINAQNPFTGATALHVAAAYKSDALGILLENGAKVDATDGQGRTALHVAALADWTEAVKALVQAKANLGAKDRRGLTPASLASERGSKRAALMLDKLVNASDSPIDAPTGAQIPTIITASSIEETGRTIRFLLLRSNRPSEVVGGRPTRAAALHSLSPWHSPTALAASILDYAGCQLEITASSNRETYVNRDQAQWQAYVYLSLPPLPSSPLLIVTHVHVETIGHDQGWSSDEQNHGTYIGSWTGFSFGTRRAGGALIHSKDCNVAGDVERGPKINSNLHASEEPRSHTLDCDREGVIITNTKSPHDPETDFRQWIVSLRPGDEVCVLADAAWPGWVNFVYHATVRVTMGFAR